VGLYLELTGLLLEQKKAFIMGKFMATDLESDIFHIVRKSMVLGFEFAASHPEMAKFSSMLMRERGTDIFKKVMQQLPIRD